MKNVAFTILTILIMTASINGQEHNTSDKTIKLYKVWVKTNEGKLKGFIYSADGDGIKISKTKKFETDALVFVASKNIKQVKFRKKGAVIKASLIGGLACAAAGYGLGLSGGDDDSGWFSYSKEEKATVGAILFGFTGGLVGAIIGSGTVKITIDYKLENYLHQLINIKRYSVYDQLHN